MRILLVNVYAHITAGADKHCLELVELLRARGHFVELLSTTPNHTGDIAGAHVAPTVTHETRDRMARRQRPGGAIRAAWNRSVAGATRLVTSGDVVDRATYDALIAAGAIRPRPPASEPDVQETGDCGGA